MRRSFSFEQLGKPIIAFFVVLDSVKNRVTGLGLGDFTIKLYDPTGADVAGALTFTLGEFGSTGAYHVSVTVSSPPYSAGDYYIEIEHATHFVMGKTASFQVYKAHHADASDASAQIDFRVFDALRQPVTGLGLGDFTFLIYKPDFTLSAVSPSLVELGDGNYRLQFDSSSDEGKWFVDATHATHFPEGKIGYWRYEVPDISGAPTIVSATNDGTGSSITLDLLAADSADELFVYYRIYPIGTWTLFGSSRIGSGELQITGLSNNTMYEFVCIASTEGSPSENPSLPSNIVREYCTDGLSSLTPVRQALYDWVDSFVPYTVIWIPSNAPQPTPPFVTLLVRPLTQIGYDHHTQPDTSGVETLIGDREFLLEIQFYGELSPQGENTAHTYAEIIATSLQTRTVIDDLAAAGIAIVEIVSTQDLTAIAATEFEARVMVEIRFRIPWQTSDNVGWIETSDAPTGTYES